MRLLFFTGMLILSMVSFGQRGGQGSNNFDVVIKSLQQSEAGQGSLNISQDTSVAKLLNQFYAINAKNPGMNGFRIRIYRDLGQKSRKQSEDVEKTFMEKYPGIAVYRSYQSPYYKVSVGDFRTREAAMKLYNQLLKEFPKAFVVPEWINFPPLE